MKFTSVAADGLASKLGIKAGDVIEALWGKPVGTAGDVNGAFRDNRRQAAIKVTVRRDGKSVELEAEQPRRRRRG